MNENKIMEQTNETVNDVNEVEETGNISGGIGILVVGAFALGGAAVVGAKKAYRWFKDRKHKPEHGYGWCIVRNKSKWRYC